MQTLSYTKRRSELEAYFDRTAAEAWSRLTSDAPVSRIRATVRAGRDRMRSTLLGWLPHDLQGMRILDAGCGTGAFAVEAARRGANVLAIDLSPTLVQLAAERAPRDLGAGSIRFAVGDMLDPPDDQFDHIVAMDSLIHYQPSDMTRAVAALTARAKRSVLFTFAPRTPALAMMHAVGRLFPRGDRAPSIEPIEPDTIRHRLITAPDMKAWLPTRSQRVACGFYTSQAMEMRKA